MKRWVYNMLAVCLLLALPGIARPQAYVWEHLSASDAADAVRAFAGDPGLILSRQSLDSYNTSDPLLFPATQLYTMTAGRYEYSVSLFSHERLTRQDRLYYDKPAFYGQPFDQVALAQQAMSRQSARAIAFAYMQAHFPNPDQMSDLPGNPVRSFPRPDAEFISEHCFNFFRYVGDGVRGPSSCFVVVDSVKGEIIGYYQGVFPVLVPTVPTLTGAQAMAAAMNALLQDPGTPGTVESLYITSPDAMGQETLAYHLSFDGGPTYIVDVDAFTGGIIHWTVLAGLGERRPSAAHARPFRPHRVALPRELKAVLSGQLAALTHPPLLIGGSPYLYIGYLAYGSPDARVGYRTAGRAVTLTGSDRRATFQAGSRLCTLNGKVRQLKAPAVLVGGRCYVPLEAAEAILPFRITYDAKRSEVRLEPALRPAL